MKISQFFPSQGEHILFNFGNNVEWEAKSFVQTAQIMNGEASGRFELTGDMYITYDSAFYTYKGTIVKGKNCSVGTWDNVFRILTSPYNDHYVSMPFSDTDEHIYITKVERKLVKRKPLPKGQVVDLNDFVFNKWENKIAVEFISMNKYAPIPS